MIITEKSFILVQEDTNIFVVDDRLEELLREEMRPILWFRMGMACVVPTEVLKNTLETIDLNKHGFGMTTIQIDWKQTFPFPDGRAATILAGLDY